MRQKLFAILLLCVLVPAAWSTDIARRPLSSAGGADANVIFGMDDSGSMDFELMLNTSDGALWWNNTTSVRSAWDAQGRPFFNDAGLPNNTWLKLAYLFPNGCGTGSRNLCDNSGHYAIPPTAQFASLRSSSYNPSFYDPAQTYKPWPTGKIGNTTYNFSNSNPVAARSHPLYTPTLNLTAVIDSTATDWTFIALRGMVIPAGSRILRNGNWDTINSPQTIGTGTYNGASYRVAVPYTPASYWVKETCTVNGTTCARAPDGATLKLYQIVTGQTFPSGRNYAQELQNFANWFTYYRKRRLALASSMAEVLNNIDGIRMGVVAFNDLKVVRMYGGENSTDPRDQVANLTQILGEFYANEATGGTPTRETLRHIGEQFRTNRSINKPEICQRNAAFIVTDGFSNASSVSVPRYNKNDFGGVAPYATTHNGSLADIALAYYSKQPYADGTNAGSKKLQMNTYAITLGARGRLWPGIEDPFAQPITWVNPTVDRSPDSIDDLWHATINGRGSMFTATTPQETAVRMQEALTEIQLLVGAQGGVTFSSANLNPSNSYAYVGAYNVKGWSGDVSAYEVDSETGLFKPNPAWSAGTLLTQRDWTTRKIVTFRNGVGVPFTAPNVGSAMNITGGTSVATAVSYFRGSRAAEPGLRARTGLMGAVIGAEPVVHPGQGVLYAVSNGGMVHALDAASGQELWAYVPGFVLGDMGAQLDPKWDFTTTLDATPVLADVKDRKYLVGSRGSAGPGVYAMDVTNPKSLDTEAALASRVKWEFPAANASTDLKKAVGTSLGKPVVVNTSKGTVVLVTSGYNSTLDGKGRLFVLNAETGELINTLVTTAGTNQVDSGLAQISAFAETTGLARFVYGGDELGNVWRFDLEAGTVFRLATLTDADGVPRPITSAPELSRIGTRRMVYVGTGRILHGSDFIDVKANGAPVTHSFYALWDNSTTISGRNQLARRTISVGTDGTRQVSGNQVDWSTQRGWYVELPAGERANTDPAMGAGVIAFTTNSAIPSDCETSSALYVADADSGLRLADVAFDKDAYYGASLGAYFTAKPVLARLTSNKLSVTTQQADGTETVRTLNLTPPVRPAKTSWREVLR